MGVFDKIKNAFGVDDDEFEDEFEYDEEDEVVENTVKPDFSQMKKEKTVPLSAASASVPASQLQVVLVKPEKFDDASGIADSLNAKKTVVLNLEATSKEDSRRLVDF